MRYAFVDESGTETPFSSDRFLVIALLSTADPRELALLMHRIRKRYGASTKSGEMKADTSQAVVIERLLRAVAETSSEVVTVVVDKRHIRRPPLDPGEIYRKAMATVARHAVTSGRVLTFAWTSIIRQLDCESGLRKRCATPSQNCPAKRF